MTGTCQNGLCFHEDELHEEGVCWKLTDTNLEDIQSVHKFCLCKQDGTIRRYDHPRMGFMPFEVDDLMITKKCSDCGKDKLLTKNETLCMFCKEKPGHYVPVNPDEYVKAMTSIVKGGGVAIGMSNESIDKIGSTNS